MSTVYFHSPSGRAGLSGRVRGQGDIYSRDLCRGLLTLERASWDSEGLGRWFMSRVSLKENGLWGPAFKPSADERSLTLHARTILMSTMGEALFSDVEGAKHEIWLIAMNTGLRAFDDPLRLAVRLHGQCEMHAWVDGPNRNWLARIMEAGLAAGIYRPGDRWESVIKFLRERHDEPVVTSFSVTEQFPSLESTGCTEREFEELDGAEAWERSLKWLRAAGGGRELEPEGFREYFFHSGMDAFKIKRMYEDAHA